MSSLFATPLFGIFVTLAAYSLAQVLYAKTKSPFLNPVAISVTIIVSILLSADIPYSDYRVGGDMILFFLGPAVVAIGLPLYQKRDEIVKMARPILFGIAAGGLSSILSAYFLASLLGGSEAVVLSFMPKSVTAPIAMGISGKIGGIPSLTAVVVVLTGCLGGVCGPEFCRFIGIRDPRAIGLAVGTAAHGIGTARMLEIDRLGGAVSGLAIGLNGIFTAVVIPMILACLY